MRFENLKLIKEYPKMISNKYPLRLYFSDFRKDESNKVRYHFGWPKFIVKPLCPLLETTLYWGEEHWVEDGNFYIYWLPIISVEGEVPYDELNKMLKFQLGSFNQCLTTMTKWSETEGDNT